MTISPEDDARNRRVGLLLRKIRNEVGASLREWGLAAGVTHNHLAQIELGNRRLAESLLRRLPLSDEQRRRLREAGR